MKRLSVLFFSILSYATLSAQTNIKFTEEEDFVVNQKFTQKAFGIDKLVILKGDYEINFEENKFGVVYLDISDESSEIKISQNKVAPAGGIRIAKRKASCSKYRCACGIGFRCGTTSLEDDGGGEEGGEEDGGAKNIKNRTFEVNISIVSNKKIKLEFTQEIDWKSLE